MTNDLVQLAVPCRMVTLKLQVGPEDGATTLEQLVIKAIGTGLSSVPQLAELFVTPYRVVMDVVVSLWGRGLLSIDLQSGGLHLSDAVRDTIGTSSDATAVEPKTEMYLYEPITGGFFPEKEGLARAPYGTLRVPLNENVRPSDLPPRELLAAVQSAMRRSGRGSGYRRRILDVSFGNPLLHPPREVRWLNVPVQVRVDGDTERLAVSLVDADRRWTTRAQDRFRVFVAQLADDQPQHSLIQKLRGRAAVTLLEPESAERLLADMAAQAERLCGLEHAQTAQAQQRLARQARQLQDQSANLVRSRAAVTRVERAQGHAWVLRDLLESAEKQVVVVTPSIRYPALSGLLHDLDAALARGVRLVLCWGRAVDDTLPPEVRTALAELERSHGSRLVLGQESSRTAACVVVQDNRRAFVGSHSALEVVDGSGAGPALGVLIEPSPHGPGAPEAVRDLLLWARDTVFPWRTTEPVLTRDDAFSPLAEDDGPAVPSPDDLPLPDPPEDDTPELRRIWADSWREHHAALAAAVRQATEETPSVDLVRDGTHEDLLWQALHGAVRRLVVADDRLTPHGASERAASALLKRAEAGAMVHLVHPASRDTDAAPAFARLATAPKPGVRVRRERAGARAFICDDTVVLGSYPPLVRGAQPGGRLGAPSHLGVRIRGPHAAADFAEALGAAAEEEPLPDPLPSAAPRGGATVAYGALVRARQDGGSRYPEVDRIMRELRDPWVVLEVWRDRKVPDADLRRAAATLLRLGDRVPPEHRHRWIRWLVSDAWKRRAFVEASLVGLLLPVHGEGGHPLTAAVCTVAMPLETGPVGGALDDAALALAHEHAQRVGAVAGLAESLLWGGAEGGQLVELWRAALPGAWQELAAAAEDVPQPLPLDVFAAQLATALSAAEAEDRWAVLAEQVEHIRLTRGRFQFGAGIAWHKGMFGENGILTLIERAALGDRQTRAELAERLVTDVRRHVDKLVADAGGERIQWKRQKFFLGRIERLVAEARTLSRTPVGRDPVRLPSAARDFAVLTAKLWDELYSEADPLPQPYGHPLLALLERLQPARQWAGDRT